MQVEMQMSNECLCLCEVHTLLVILLYVESWSGIPYCDNYIQLYVCTRMNRTLRAPVRSLKRK